MRKISIVGAGPGALDLLTLRAEKRLKEAEVVVWTDSLISPELIQIVPKTCECIPTRSLTLEEIIPILIDRCLKGKKVVRLHDGDPCLYGAISEQICQLNDAGISVEVIPGVSAYQATAAAINTELTIPGVTQTIILSRAPGRTGIPHKEELQNLASIGATLCLYLSARHVKEVESILLNFYPKDTQVVIGHRVSWPKEILEIVPLKEMSSTSQKYGLDRTTLYIVSPALNATKKRSKLYHPNHTHLFRDNKQSRAN